MQQARIEPGLPAARHESRRHFSAIALAFAAGSWLAACAPLPPRRATAPTQPLARLEVAPVGNAATIRTWLLAAEFALQDGDAAKAADAYARAAAKSGDRAIAARALQLALAARDVALVQRGVDRMQALGAGAAELAGARAQLALVQGDAAAAQKQFRLQLAAGKLDDWKAFAAALLGTRDRALAVRVMEGVAQPARLPDNEPLWVALSQLGEHLGQHAYARTLADAAVRKFGGADSIRWAASLRLAARDRAGALALYARGVAAHPADASLRIGYAALLVDAGRTSEAMRILAQGPQTTATWAARVATAARANDSAGLRALYAQLQRASPAAQTDNAFLLGQLAELLQHDRAALAWYARVDADDTHGFDAQVRSAVLLDKLGEAERAGQIAVRLQRESDDPDAVRTAFELEAQLYSRHADHANAIAAYDRGLAALPGDKVLTYDRGIEEADAGHVDDALADFRKVLEQDPKDIEAMNALGFTLADAGRDLPEATTLLREALAARPDAAEVMDSWGWLQYRLGNLAQAEDFLQRAWSKQRQPDIGVHLGEVLWRRGQHVRARALFKEVRKLDPHNDALARAERKLQP